MLTHLCFFFLNLAAMSWLCCTCSFIDLSCGQLPHEHRCSNMYLNNYTFWMHWYICNTLQFTSPLNSPHHARSVFFLCLILNLAPAWFTHGCIITQRKLHSFNMCMLCCHCSPALAIPLHRRVEPLICLTQTVYMYICIVLNTTYVDI